jgi:hypothetical protein
MGHVFNEAAELQKQGMYEFVGTAYGYPYPPVSKLSPPITPKENLQRYFEKKNYDWIPDLSSDLVDITPDCIPDVKASDFEGGIDSLGVEWVPLENGLPAMVRPGNPKLKDIADWEKLPWPNVDAWDWEGCAAEYNAKLGDDRVKRGVILSGFFERLISLMDFENAAVALIEDPDLVSAFFAKLADMNILIVEHYKKYFHVDSIMLHDDWAAQRAPFFSVETARKVILPHLKRVIDRTHEMGLQFTHHCCGNVFNMIPLMIEAGADATQVQEDALDFAKALELYGEKIRLESYWIISETDSEIEVKSFISDLLVKICGKERGLIMLMDLNPERAFDLREYYYTMARKMAADKH